MAVTGRIIKVPLKRGDKMGDFWYHLDKIIKKNKLFNYIIAPRGCGKTMEMKRRMVERGLQGKLFVYVRRRDKELNQNKMNNFFKKMQKAGYYVDKELTYEKEQFFCDGKLIGYSAALSTSTNQRSMEFIDVTDIYFEEFVLKEDKVHKYLDDEVAMFLELYSTIAREEDVVVYFFGNMIHKFNPYFLYFNLIPPKGQNQIKCWGESAIEVWCKKEFVEHKKQSRFSKLIDGTQYAKYAEENMSFLNVETFIKKKPKGCIPIFTIIHGNSKYTVWRSINGQSFCDEQKAVSKFTIATSQGVAIKGSVTPKGAKMEYPVHMKVYCKNLETNNVFYSSEKVEEEFRLINRILYF